MRFIITCFFSLLVLSCFGQGKIRSIEVKGLKKTNPAYIDSFLMSEVGDPLDSTVLERDRQRLANLEMIGSSELIVESESGDYKVIFECTELFSLVPIVGFGSVQDNFWIQMGASESNFLGRGHKIMAYYMLYDRSSFAVHSTFDRIRQTNWGINLNLVKWGTIEPLFFKQGTVDYEYDNYTVGFDGIYHFSFIDRLLVGGAYFIENYKAASELVEGAPVQAKTSKLLFKIILSRYKFRDHFFYRSGYANDIVAQTVQSLDGDPEFYIIYDEFKWFKRVGKRGNLGFRFKTGLSTNVENPFAPFVLDSYLNIRGVGNRVDRGTGMIVSNLEYRHTILEYERLAIQCVAFSDIGTWRQPNGSLRDFSKRENLVFFGGLGTRLIHKKIHNAIFRIDYGFDLLDVYNNGVVLGIGQYF